MSFHWHEKYCIGITEIDKQHKTYLEMLNAVDEAYTANRDNRIASGDKMNVYKDILKLREYALTHFLAEERYMIRFKYPDFFKHKAEHDEFILRIFEMEKLLFQREPSELATSDLIGFILGWFKNHIIQIDREFGSFVARQSARQEASSKQA